MFHFLLQRGGRLGCVVIAFCLCLVARSFSAEPKADEPANWVYEATNQLGSWVWETNALDKQTVRFWKAFTIPSGANISKANLRITVDNGYTLFLDGREIGRGSDWRTVTEYDVTQLLSPGRHVLAVEGFNDRLEGGFIFGMRIDQADKQSTELVSDDSWFIVPAGVKNWVRQTSARPGWHRAQMIGAIGHHPWENWPYGLAVMPPLMPIVMHFWEKAWFQLTVLTTALLAVLLSLWLMTRLAAQSRAQKFLQVERARIARDIHDDLGAQLTQLLLTSEVAQREQLEDSPARGQFTEICGQARELAHALDEVVWVVNSQRDTVRHFVSYVCKYAQMYLQTTSIRCRLDVEPEIPATSLGLHTRRNLFLAVKEALNNAAKYSQASELFLRIFRRENHLTVIVEDNGVGFDAGQLSGERNGMTNMQQRMNEVGGAFGLASQPGGGCLVSFAVPLPREPRRWFRRADREDAAASAAEFSSRGSGI